MCFVPGFENDIFIRYAHNNNSTHVSKPEDARRNLVSLLENYIRMTQWFHLPKHESLR